MYDIQFALLQFATLLNRYEIAWEKQNRTKSQTQTEIKRNSMNSSVFSS